MEVGQSKQKTALPGHVDEIVSQHYEVQFQFNKKRKWWTTKSSHAGLDEAKKEHNAWGGSPDYRIIHFVGKLVS